MPNKQENTKIDTGNYNEFFLLLNRTYETIIKNGWTTDDLIVYQDNRWVNIATPKMNDAINEVLSEWTFVAQTEFRTIASVLHTAFTDDMSRILAILNNLLPRMIDYSQSERENYDYVKKISGDEVMEADEVLELLGKEEMPYIRRLISAAVGTSSYQSSVKTLRKQVIDEMEEISIGALTQFQKFDEEIALQALVSIGADSQKVRSFETQVPRYDFIKKNLPLLTSLANFDRNNGGNMARFMTGLPNIMTWVVGGRNFDRFDTMEMDAAADLFHNAVMFNRLMAIHQDRATQLRFRLSHGYPEYRELIKLFKDTDSLFAWTLEGMIFRLASLLPNIVNKMDPNERHRLTKWLTFSGILPKYAEHKGIYIKRRNG